MGDLPKAFICHLSSGRVRVRIPAMRNDASYFSRIEEFLSPIPGIEKVATNPKTASVLVLHNIELENTDDLESVASYSEMTGLFKLVVPDRRPAPLTQNLAAAFDALNERLKSATGGVLDIPGVGVLGLLGITIVQVSQGAVAVPAITALWYASSILTYQLSKQQIEAPRVEARTSAETQAPDIAAKASNGGEG
jgi:hypothetical protein